jgi:hypothetical protein
MINIPSLLVAVYAYNITATNPDPANPYKFFADELKNLAEVPFKNEAPTKKLLLDLLAGKVDFTKGLAKYLYRIGETLAYIQLTQDDLNKIFVIMAVGPFVEANNREQRRYRESLAFELAKKITDECGISEAPWYFEGSSTKLSIDVLREDLISSLPADLQAEKDQLKFFTRTAENDSRLEDLRHLLITYVMAYLAKKGDVNFFKNTKRLTEDVVKHANAYEKKKHRVKVLLADRTWLMKQRNPKLDAEIRELGRKIKWELYELRDSYTQPVFSAIQRYRDIIGNLPPTIKELEVYMLHEEVPVRKAIDAVVGSEEVALKGILGEPPSSGSSEDAEKDLEALQEHKLATEVLAELNRILLEIDKGEEAVAFDSGAVDADTFDQIQKEVDQGASPTKKALLGLTSFVLVAGAIIWYRKGKSQK